MEAAKLYRLTVEFIPKSAAGNDAKAPAVYLDDTVLAGIKGPRDGKITEKELTDELDKAGVPTYPKSGGGLFSFGTQEKSS